MDGTLPHIVAEDDECAEILSYLARFTAIPSVEDAWQLHIARMARYGFDRVFYRFSGGFGPQELLEETLVLSNHARSFLDPYLQRGMWRDTLFQHHAEVTGVQATPWRMTPDMQATPRQLRARNFMLAHGLVAGVSMSFRSITPYGRAGIGLCARADLDQDAVDAIWERHGTALLLMNTALHLRVATLPMSLPARRLTRRQQQVLGGISDGKTVQDIALLLGLGTATVEKHLRLARAALGVQTTAQAVLKAALLNQLFRVPPWQDQPGGAAE